MAAGGAGGREAGFQGAAWYRHDIPLQVAARMKAVGAQAGGGKRSAGQGGLWGSPEGAKRV